MPDSTQGDNPSPQRDPPPEAPDKPEEPEKTEDDAPEPEKQIAEEKTGDETLEENPPLPPGPPPEDEPDDGWQPVWDPTYGRYYFYNTYTQETTWQNPRIPEADGAAAEASPDAVAAATTPGAAAEVPHDPLRYNPAIHGDYDPTAPYAQVREEAGAPGQEPDYTITAAFNRFTGKFQPAQSHMVPENYSAENKSKRQMQLYFDVDAAANSHEGRSLKAERQAKKLSKKELKQFKEKRKKKKEEKRKAWLKD